MTFKSKLQASEDATGSLLWHQDFNTQGGLSFGSFAAGIFWTYNPGTHLLEGFDETTQHKKWERANLVLEPRSAYHLSGPARFKWEHSIPQMEALRYSITFRNVRED